MMGDNRDNSLDSRANGGWFVPFENLVGKGNFIFFSISGDTRFWQFWRWPFNVRYNRIFKKIK
jgi:signal peptidase I